MEMKYVYVCELSPFKTNYFNNKGRGKYFFYTPVIYFCCVSGLFRFVLFETNLNATKVVDEMEVKDPFAISRVKEMLELNKLKQIEIPLQAIFTAVSLTNCNVVARRRLQNIIGLRNFCRIMSAKPAGAIVRFINQNKKGLKFSANIIELVAPKNTIGIPRGQ